MDSLMNTFQLMESLNTELNSILSEPNLQPHVSVDTMYSDGVLYTETSESNCLGADACTPINSTFNTPESGECFGAYASTDDTTSTPQIDEYLSDCDHRSDTTDTSQSGCGECLTDSELHNDLPNEIETEETLEDDSTVSTLESSECFGACALTDDTPSTQQTDEYISDCDHRSDTTDTSESDCGESDCEECFPNRKPKFDLSNTMETEESLDDMSTEKIVNDIFHIITELTEYTYTEKELNGYDLVALDNERRKLEEKGLFTSRMMADTNKIVKKRYVKKINWDDYNNSIDVLKKYDALENLAIEVNSHAHEMKNKKTAKILLDNQHLHSEILSGFEKIDEGAKEIARQLDKLQQINIPSILDTMPIFEEMGLLSDLLIYKLKYIGQGVVKLGQEITNQIRRMDAQLKEINRTVKELNEKGSVNGKKIGTVVIYVNCKDKVSAGISPGVYRRKKQPQKAIEQSKDQTCRSEHKTPFCGKCGWQRSWANGFKRRGIYIKETAASNDRNIWINTVDKI